MGRNGRAIALAGALVLVIAPRTAGAADPNDPNPRGRLDASEGDSIDALLELPRALLYPFHLLAEYAFRRPLYAFATWVDESHMVQKVERVLHPTPDLRWSPTFWFDLGVFASLGAAFEWRNALVSGNDFSISAATGGLQIWHLSVKDRIALGPLWLGARGDFLTRNDRDFYGLGPRSPNVETHFRETRYEAFAFTTLGTTRHLVIEMANGFRGEVGGSSMDSPSIETAFKPQDIPGFQEPVRLAMGTLDIRADSRSSYDDEGGGASVAANAAYARDVVRPTRVFVKGTLDARAAIEVVRPGRVLTARAYVVDNVPLDRDPVPFTELAMLGWANHIGFQWGRFRGESAVLGELSYRYPIAYYLDADLIASAGNVFTRTFSDFDFGALTTSWAIALRTRRWGPAPLVMAMGVGSTRLEEKFSIESFRFFVGTSEGP
jgi:hypothetical protein